MLEWDNLYSSYSYSTKNSSKNPSSISRRLIRRKISSSQVNRLSGHEFTQSSSIGIDCIGTCQVEILPLANVLSLLVHAMAHNENKFNFD